MMNIKTIYKMQGEYGISYYQKLINDGSIWHMEGSMGRYAIDLLNSGACMLPKTATSDAYGNKIPSRDKLVSGTKGTFENSVNFWSDDHNLMALEMQNEPEEGYFEHY